ncbi:hypothetical protein AB0F88_08370 [Streptosporangium sp. NPDC023963]|uniref:hypothetical protein n=1 Tax=Streptosporangium sp. NPDC023963 TaxID=3155608 RepID=UPI00343CEFF8
MTGDSKLISYANLAAMKEAGVTFIAPASRNHVSAATLAGQDLKTAPAVDYAAARDAGRFHLLDLLDIDPRDLH